MNRVFPLGQAIEVPDDTILHPIIGPRQLFLDKLPLFPEASISLGILPAGIFSDIHIHPVVHHIAWCVSGTLTVKMKDNESDDAYKLTIPEKSAASTRPGTFFQLRNESDQECQVLYICGPAFVFELNESTGEVIYNDAFVFEGMNNDESWEELKRRNWKVPELEDLEKIRKARQESYERMANHSLVSK